MSMRISHARGRTDRPILNNLSEQAVKIIEIQGIGSVYAKKLQGAGIDTAEVLLDRGSTRKGREELSAKTGISDKLILRWVNHADLARIVGVADQFSELLEAAGVDSVPELAQRMPKNLHAKLVETNDKRKLAGRIPSVGQLKDWIEQSKKLDRTVHH